MCISIQKNIEKVDYENRWNRIHKFDKMILVIGQLNQGYSFLLTN